MFILSALDKRGSFHVAKVIILIIMCNSFLAKKREAIPSGDCLSFSVFSR